MSIQSEIDRIEAAVESAYVAVAGMGGTVPQPDPDIGHRQVEGLASAIKTIPQSSGGSTVYSKQWTDGSSVKWECTLYDDGKCVFDTAKSTGSVNINTSQTRGYYCSTKQGGHTFPFTLSEAPMGTCSVADSSGNFFATTIPGSTTKTATGYILANASYTGKTLTWMTHSVGHAADYDAALAALKAL